MLLERTISQLNSGPMAPDRAEELAAMGYQQWLYGLPGEVSFPDAAAQAHIAALPYADTSPAVAVFCDMLRAAMILQPMPLRLQQPVPQRRGGARARRKVR